MGWHASREKSEGWVGFNKLQPTSLMFFHLKVEGQVGGGGTSMGCSLHVKGSLSLLLLSDHLTVELIFLLGFIYSTRNPQELRFYR